MRAACSDNLKNIELGVRNYACVWQDRFPRAVLPLANHPPADRLSWLYEILPLVESDIIYSLVDQKRPWNAEENRRVALADVQLRIGLPGVADHRRRAVDRQHGVAELLQMARKSPLTAADVDRQAPRRRQGLEEAVAVEEPVGVVPRLACPARPIGGVAFPVLAQRHAQSVIPLLMGRSSAR